MNAQYSLDFGDGSPIFSTSCSNGCGQLTNVYQIHTYTSAGTYTAKLTSYNQPAVPYYATATAVVTVGSATSNAASLSVAEAPASVVYDGSISVSWAAQNAPSDSVVALYLVETSGKSRGVIASGKPTNGSTNWTVPSISAACADCPYIDSPPPAGTYVVVARIYTPSNAWISGFPPSPAVHPTFWATASSSAFSITAP